MKVIKDNYNKQIETHTEECERCNSVVELTGNNVDENNYWNCPLCGFKNCADSFKTHLTFPDDFYHFGMRPDTYVQSNEEIEDEIKKLIDIMRTHKNDDDAFDIMTSSMSDTLVVVERYCGDKEYYVCVAKNYWSAYLPFDVEDY